MHNEDGVHELLIIRNSENKNQEARGERVETLLDRRYAPSPCKTFPRLQRPKKPSCTVDYPGSIGPRVSAPRKALTIGREKRGGDIQKYQNRKV